MPWKVQIQQDTDNPNRGTVTATYTAVDAMTGVVMDTFVYSRVVTRGGADPTKFVGECKSELASYRAKKTTITAAAAQLEALLNA